MENVAQNSSSETEDSVSSEELDYEEMADKIQELLDTLRESYTPPQKDENITCVIRVYPANDRSAIYTDIESRFRFYFEHREDAKQLVDTVIASKIACVEVYTLIEWIRNLEYTINYLAT